MNFPKVVKELISEYEGPTFRIGKERSILAIKSQNKTEKNDTYLINLELKSGLWHVLQSPIREVIMDMGDYDLSYVLLYNIILYHNSLDLESLPSNIHIAARKCDSGKPDPSHCSLLVDHEIDNVSFVVCGIKPNESKESPLMEIRLNDDPEDITTYQIDFLRGIKEGLLLTAIVIPIIVVNNSSLRKIKEELYDEMKSALIKEAKEKTDLPFAMNGSGGFVFNNPTKETLQYFGLSPIDRKKNPLPVLKELIINRKGVWGTGIDEKEYELALSDNGNLDYLLDLSNDLDDTNLRKNINNPYVRSAFKSIDIIF